MIGQVLNHYLIEAQLGAGGMGVVFKAYDVRLERPVAIKLLARPSDQAAREVLREARVVSALNHPHICTIYEVGEAEGQAFIVMEHVEGRTLTDLIPADGLTVESAVAYAVQIADAVGYAHDHGVIHRDLKSANIVITPEGRAKVLDFGLARRLSRAELEATSTKTTHEELDDSTAGTLAYIAPEILRGQQADARSDVWAIGVVLYEMLAGRLPFNGRNNLELSTEILREPPWPLRASIDTGLRSVVLRSLMKEPRQRYQRANEMRAALETIQQEIEGPAAPSARLHPLPPTIHQRIGRKTILTGAAALVVLVTLFLSVPQTRRLILPSASRIERNAASAGRLAVAVFPFRAVGSEADVAHLAGGLSDTLAARLFQSTTWHVASGAAVERAGKRGSIDAAAHELGVDLVVTGTVRQVAGSLRILVSLEDVKQGQRLWAQEVSGDRSDLLSMEDRLHAGLLEALGAAPRDRAPATPTVNIEAYDLYLKGKNAVREQPGAAGARAAIRFYEDALLKDPRFALAHAAMVDPLLLLHRETRESVWAEKAQFAAEQAQQLDPTRAETHLARGTVHIALGKAPEALAALKRALELSPNSDRVHRELGRAYAATGRGAEAMQALRNAVEINPYEWENYNALGSAAVNLGRWGEAAAAFRKVTELEPDRVNGYSNVGAVYIYTGEYDAAADALQRALKLQEHPSTYTNLGITYANTARFAEAVRMFEKAVELGPGDARLANLADGYRWLGQREKASNLYDSAIALSYKKLRVNPRDAEATAALALAYAKKGNSPQAMQFIAKARSIKPDDVNFVYYEAIIRLLGGDTSAALQALRDAFRAGYRTGFARRDPDFRVLRSDPGFQALMKEFSAETQ